MFRNHLPLQKVRTPLPPQAQDLYGYVQLHHRAACEAHPRVLHLVRETGGAEKESGGGEGEGGEAGGEGEEEAGEVRWWERRGMAARGAGHGER